VLRACATAEQTGVPSIAIVSTGFVHQANGAAKALGIEGVAIVEYPGLIPMDSDDEFTVKMHDVVVPGVLAGFTRVIDRDDAREEPAFGEIAFRGTFDEVLDHFHSQQWTDGLPVVPPTRARVDRFLAECDRDPAEVIAVLAPEQREATVESVAINAVMAGCRPEYMPLALAAVEAIADPGFRLQDAGSTPSWEPLAIVSGAITKRFGFNSEGGAMRLNVQPNSSVGRFVRLFIRNVSRFVPPPGTTDKASIGYSFNAAMAENEDATTALGWDPFRVDQGFALTDDVVTVQSVVAISPPVYCGGDAASAIEPLTYFMTTTCGPWAYTGVRFARWHPVILMSPSVATTFVRDGWSKADIAQHLYEHCLLPAGLMEHYAFHAAGQDQPFAELVELGAAPALYAESDDPERLVPVLRAAEWVRIVVGGDTNRNQCRIYINNHEQGAPVSRVVVPKSSGRR
jgi:hypothetical protein